MVYIYGIGPIFGVVRSSLNPVKGLNEFRERGGGSRNKEVPVGPRFYVVQMGHVDPFYFRP